jgi:hypothetical protein
VVVGAIGLYVLLWARRHTVAYALSAGGWLLAFVAYSELLFGRPLPAYYVASRLQLRGLPSALPGHLFSPSRGLFVYVPVLVVVGWMLVRYRRTNPSPRLVLVSLLVMGLHVFLVSCIADWWVGNYYGPRLTTGLVPWFALVGALAIAAYRARAPRPARADTVVLTLGAVTLAAAVFLNGTGAVSVAAVRWYDVPVPFEHEARARVWDWAHAQFLAPFVGVAPLPHLATVGADGAIPVAVRAGKPFLWYGWSTPEKSSSGEAFRWSASQRTALAFRTPAPVDAVTFDMIPFIHGPVTRQRVRVRINGRLAASLTLRTNEFRAYRVEVPADERAARKFRIVLELPDARTPMSIGYGDDPRNVAVAVRDVTLQYRR